MRASFPHPGVLGEKASEALSHATVRQLAAPPQHRYEVE